MRRISMAARDELVAAIVARYAQGDRCERGRILDEFTAVTGFHRKAMRLLRAGPVSGRGGPRRGRRVYALDLEEWTSCRNATSLLARKNELPTSRTVPVQAIHCHMKGRARTPADRLPGPPLACPEALGHDP